MLKAEQIERSSDQSAKSPIETPRSPSAGDAVAKLRTDRHQPPSIKSLSPAKQSDATAGGHESRPAPNRRLRWALFGVLPVVLLAGAYWYVTGGAVMSTDDAYVDAHQIGS